jgi:hypothetical protein
MLNTVITYVRRHHVALIALVFAMGGTAYAAAKVGSRDIKNGSVRTKDIKNDSVISRDVDNGSLRSIDVRQGSIRAQDLAAGATDSVISSALVVGEGATSVGLVDADGFTDVERTGLGEYTLSFSEAAPVCGVALTPLDPIAATNPPVSLSVESFSHLGTSPQQITVAIADQQGNPADLGLLDFGYAGFSIITGTCGGATPAVSGR